MTDPSNPEAPHAPNTPSLDDVDEPEPALPRETPAEQEISDTPEPPDY